MTKTYAQIVQQIEALKQEAESLRQAEVAEVITKIREAIRVYGLTAADLSLTATRKTKVTRSKAPASFPSANLAAGPKKGRATKAGKSSKGKGFVKFRNDSGGVWGGIGKRPQWLRDALNAGKKLEDFAVN